MDLNAARGRVKAHEEELLVSDTDSGQRGDSHDRRSPAESPGEDESGAAGHPEPGSGHDDSRTTTTDAGPPRKPVDGIPGASGEVEIQRPPGSG